MAALDRTGVAGNTWVIFTSDNGPWLSYGESCRLSLSFARGQRHLLGRRHTRTVHHALAGQNPAATESKEMFHEPRPFPDDCQTHQWLSCPNTPSTASMCGPSSPARAAPKNPHTAYWFYYEVNQLQATVTAMAAGNFKLPHAYRTLAGKPGGHGGTPAPYEQRKLEKAELYRSGQQHQRNHRRRSSTSRCGQAARSRSRRARQELGRCPDQAHRQGNARARTGRC